MSLGLPVDPKGPSTCIVYVPGSLKGPEWVLVLFPYVDLGNDSGGPP